MRSCSSKAGILLCNTIEQGLNFGLTFTAQHLDFKFPESGQALKGQGQMSPRVQNPPALTNPRYSGTQLLPNQVHMRFNGRWRKQLPRIQKMSDRKSTRLNSSHVRISYAVFCLKKKK